MVAHDIIIRPVLSEKTYADIMEQLRSMAIFLQMLQSCLKSFIVMNTKLLKLAMNLLQYLRIISCQPSAVCRSMESGMLGKRISTRR